MTARSPVFSQEKSEMKLLYLAQRVPYPPDRGDKIITFHQVQHLARNHEVLVGCLAQDDADLENASRLRSIVSEVHAVRLSPMRAKLRALRSLALGEPFTVGYFCERELHEYTRSLVAEGSLDAIITFCSGVAQFAERACNVPRIIHFCDLDSLKWKQYAVTAMPPARWIYALESRRLLEYERRLARTFDYSLVCTPKELEDFQRLVASERVACVPNGVDVEYFRPTDTTKDELSLVFTGVMDYLPNVDAAKWFCQEILPLVRQRRPRVTFTICGARPTPAVKALAAAGGIAVTGSVPDVRPYLAKAAVAVVPVRIARGIQNKVLEAMAMGLPVVTTTRAFEGIDAVSGTDLLAADKPEEFADLVSRLLDDPRWRAQMGRAARARIEQSYRWEVPLGQLDAILDQTIGRRRLHGDS